MTDEADWVEIAISMRDAPIQDLMAHVRTVGIERAVNLLFDAGILANSEERNKKFVHLMVRIMRALT